MSVALRHLSEISDGQRRAIFAKMARGGASAGRQASAPAVTGKKVAALKKRVEKYKADRKKQADKFRAARSKTGDRLAFSKRFARFSGAASEVRSGAARGKQAVRSADAAARSAK